MSDPEIAHGPIIQPRSVNQKRVSAGPEVEAMGEVLGGLDREATVNVDGALRPARGPRGVDDHVGGLGVGLRAIRVGALAGLRACPGFAFELVPPAVAIRIPGRVRPTLAETSDDDHPADRRRHGDGLVGGLLEGHDAAAAQEPVRRDEHGCPAVVQPRGDGRRPVAREDRGEDGPQEPEGQDGDGGLGDHREQDADAITGPDALGREHRGGALHCVAEMSRREPADLAVLTFPDERLGARLALGSRVDRGGGMVERPAHPPARPLGPAAEVEGRPGPALPRQGEIVGRGGPEPGGVADGASLERLEIGEAGRPQEPGQPGVAQVPGAGAPGGVGDVTAEDRPGRRRRRARADASRLSVPAAGAESEGSGSLPLCAITTLRRLLPILAALAVMVVVAGCDRILQASPAPTPMDFPGIAGELATQGILIGHPTVG